MLTAGGFSCFVRFASATALPAADLPPAALHGVALSLLAMSVMWVMRPGIARRRLVLEHRLSGGSDRSSRCRSGGGGGALQPLLYYPYGATCGYSMRHYGVESWLLRTIVTEICVVINANEDQSLLSCVFAFAPRRAGCRPGNHSDRSAFKSCIYSGV